MRSSMVKVAASPGEVNGVNRLTRSGTGGVRRPAAVDAQRSLKALPRSRPVFPLHGTVSGVRSAAGDVLDR